MIKRMTLLIRNYKFELKLGHENKNLIVNHLFKIACRKSIGIYKLQEITSNDIENGWSCFFDIAGLLSKPLKSKVLSTGQAKGNTS